MTNTAADHAATALGFHALSDETRLAIIEMLKDGERCVCELQDNLGAAQSRLSFHLKVLKDAGFVSDRREGRWSFYELNRAAFDEVESNLKELRPPMRRVPSRDVPSRRVLSGTVECCG